MEILFGRGNVRLIKILRFINMPQTHLCSDVFGNQYVIWFRKSLYKKTANAVFFNDDAIQNVTLN